MTSTVDAVLGHRETIINNGAASSCYRKKRRLEPDNCRAGRRCAERRQNQAHSALLFLYREVLAINLPWLSEVVRAKAPARLPVVLTRAEVACLLGA